MDGSDRQRIEESAIEFTTLMEDERLFGLPILLYVNKQDIFNAASDREASERERGRRGGGGHHYAEFTLAATASVS